MLQGHLTSQIRACNAVFMDTMFEKAHLRLIKRYQQIGKHSSPYLYFYRVLIVTQEIL